MINAMFSSSKKLINAAKRPADSFGISLEAAGNIALTNEVRTSILKCLFDTDSDEVGWGLWFCEGLLIAGRLEGDIKDALIQRLPELMDSSDHTLREAAVRNVLLLRNELRCQYKGWMLRCLDDKYHGVRQLALINSKTFLGHGEIEPLVKFRTDPYCTEISMMGSWVYLLRDEALNQIEHNLGRTFDGVRLSEIIETDKTVLWRDWSKFLEWWNSRWRRWWQKRSKSVGKKQSE